MSFDTRVTENVEHLPAIREILETEQKLNKLKIIKSRMEFDEQIINNNTISHTIIDFEIDFTNINHKKIIFNHCILNKIVYESAPNLGKDRKNVLAELEFNSCLINCDFGYPYFNINNDITFYRCDFFGIVNFSDAIFSHEALFISCTFQGILYFHNCQFEKESNFSGCHFKNLTHFSGSQFKLASKFRFIKVESSTDFSDIKFLDLVDFENSEFHGEDRASFWRSIFTKKCIFKKVEFYHLADFTIAKFYGESIFEETNFLGYANFEGAHFANREDENSKKCKYDFRNTIFSDKANFNDAEFHGLVSFTSVRFPEDVNFEFCVLTNTINFNSCFFDGSINFSGTNLRQVEFRRGETSTDNRKGSITFFQTVIKGFVNFNNSFFESFNFYETAFPDNIKLPLPENIKCELSRDYYRLFKHQKLLEHDQISALNYYALEMKQHAKELIESNDIKKLDKQITESKNKFNEPKKQEKKIIESCDISSDEIFNRLLIFIIMAILACSIFGVSEICVRIVIFIIFMVFTELFLSEICQIIDCIISHLKINAKGKRYNQEEYKRQKQSIQDLKYQLRVLKKRIREDRILLFLSSLTNFGTSWIKGVIVFGICVLLVSLEYALWQTFQFSIFSFATMTGLLELVFFSYLKKKWGIIIASFIIVISFLTELPNLHTKIIEELVYNLFANAILLVNPKSLWGNADIPLPLNLSREFFSAVFNDILRIGWTAFYGAMTWQIIVAFRKYSRSLE